MQLPIVNDDDEVIGYLEKDKAYRQNAMLRSVQVFLFDSSKRLYVQKRASQKQRFPNTYCASAAGHVDLGESYGQAAARELEEELGIKAPLTFICKRKTPIDEIGFAMMAYYQATSDAPITLQEAEVDSGAFYTLDEIQHMIARGAPFTPSFLFAFSDIEKEAA
jgi:isopentenyl-diphosphate delta-isomerase type 1